MCSCYWRTRCRAWAGKPGVTAALTAALVPTYSLITIDAEPGVLRLWPTPTNGDIADAIEEWFQGDYDV